LSTGSGAEMIMSLQAGRAIAALMVLVHHAHSSNQHFIAEGPAFADALFTYGYLGVDFFFVLSGFIIYFTTRDAERTRTSARSYLRKRAVRIFVPYLPIGLALACAYMLLPGLSGSDRTWSWFATLTLLPSDRPPALNVAWTLQHELVFYAIFGLLFFSGALLKGMLLWLSAIVLAFLLAPDLGRTLQIVLAPINVEFMLGMLAAHLAMQNRRLPLRWLVPAVLLPVLAFWALGLQREHSPLIGLAIACALPSLCHWEERRVIRVGPTMILLGAASYAIYLVHPPLLAIGSRLLAWAGFESYWIAMAVLVPAATLAGLIYHLSIETPALAFVRRFRRRERGHGAPA
jgi:exopolysaccharide production protein ExoZ